MDLITYERLVKTENAARKYLLRFFIILISFAGVSASEAVAIAFTGRIIQTASWLPWWVADVVKKGNIKPPRPMMIET